MQFFQVSADADLNVDFFSSLGSYSEFDTVVSASVGVPVNGPISISAPWSMVWKLARASGGSWPGHQVFETPDAQWVRKVERNTSSGAVTASPWLKVTDFNEPGVTY